ncbi:endonuclease/exonuclease/phosphatase family protein [Novosphingobium sp. PC22D]|uniref:endonuclease/exonuclease/phosphatase family protein n=1 Tax=Novosphingobium sp. PC22D TaxID=1962403 RepID=UPI000BF19A7D|nr:endonuclease/exonuclease/phosphatase family protein [Novosphingobium sp. PC22D]
MGLSVLMGGALVAQPTAPNLTVALGKGAPRASGEFDVLTYNVKGMPWPLAQGRPAALGAIAGRLARMRAERRQPQVVLLQEAFTPEAKAIGRLAGYRYVVEGAYVRGAPGDGEMAGRSWRLGETVPAMLDSGLIVLSDYPVRRVSRAAFPAAACAGYDCLAAKGVLVVELELPGGRTLAVATTHFNSRGASAAPRSRTADAYARQSRFLADYLARVRESGMPLVLAGDFNRGDRPARIAMLSRALGTLGGHDAPRDALTQSVANDASGHVRSRDAAWIRKRGRDLQYALDGETLKVRPVGVQIPFGTEPDGTMLSDHMGYTVRYRIAPRMPGRAPTT